jgi:hypothetical protein
MKVRSLGFVALLIAASLFSTVRQIRAQEATIASGLVNSIAGGLSVNLIGYGLTSIGLNSEAAYETNVESELAAINNDLDTISTELTEIQDAIQTQTCEDELSSSSVTDALASIATVANTYTQLLQAGENPDGSVSQADIDNFLNQVANGPSTGFPSMDTALNTINIALQSTDNDGIIGTCEKAVTSVPATGSFGADLTFYSDPINLVQYFADYQTMAALMLVEYYHYEAFLSSPYYSSTTISNNLPADEAGAVCTNPTGETATQCGFARDITEELYAYLQNQYTANGVPYSTESSSGNLLTGLYLGSSGIDYLFATSIENFTSSEDAGADCPSVMTESNGCGLAFSNDPQLSPFWSSLSTYQYETAWEPATAEMWRTLLDAWASGSSSNTVATGLSTLGLQNTVGKIILTPTTYYADPEITNTGNGNLYPFPSNTDEAVCYLDTNLTRSFSLQPFCYNGSNNNVDYGNIGATMWLWDTWNGGGCMTFRTNDTVLDATEDNSFYGVDYTYDSYLNIYGASEDSGCPSGSWVNGQAPGWVVQSGATGNGFVWPAIDVSSPTCGTNYSYGLLQPAVTRTATNSLGVPTMCGADFDNYFAGIQPRNPYLQIGFTTAPMSGGVNSTFGPITIQVQDVSSGTAVAVTQSSDLRVDLSTTGSGSFGVYNHTTGVFNDNIHDVVITAGNSSVNFYYTGLAAGTPQLTADPGTMVPGNQVETITSTSTASPEVSGTADNVDSNKTNGEVTIKGQFTVPSGIDLQRTFLTIQKLVSEDEGAGELIRDAQGRTPQLPITPVTNPGGNAYEATYQTKSGATPRVRVKIALNKKVPTQGQLQMVVDKTRIISPNACTGNPPRTQLHTRILADDTANPANPPAVFDVTLSWKCGKGGKLTTP